MGTYDGKIEAFDPATGDSKGSFPVSSQGVNASPAIDADLNVLYAVDEDGHVVALELPGLQEKWTAEVGSEASSIVIGADASVYVSGGGRVYALHASDGTVKWQSSPDLYEGGTASTPAVSESGFVYVLFTAGKKDLQGDEDSLYGLNPDGSRRWAAALGEGGSDDIFSSPKIDEEGFIYIGSGYRAWIIGGVGGPANSPWPMFQRDAASSGRAR